MNKEERIKQRTAEKRDRFVRAQTRITLGICFLCCGIAWALYLCKLAGFDVVAAIHPDLKDDKINFTMVYLIIAVAITVLFGGWGLFKIRRLKHLAANGIEVTGMVTAQGVLRKKGVTPVTITYTVEGKEYRIKKDMAASMYPVGKMVPVFCDPSRPSVCEVI